MENRFEIIFGADGRELTKTLGQLETDLKAFNKELKTVGDATALTSLNKKIAETKTHMEAIKQVGLSEQLTKIRPGASQATASLTNMSRVVQDMPFGFIGIANNIDPLIESFGRLSTATKDTGGPLKALAGSMIGPAGIGIAVATVSSIITAAIQKYGSLGAAVNEVFGLIDNTIRASRELNKTLATAGASVAGEVAAVEALLSIARDEANSKTVRLQAMNKLNDEYDKYLPNLTLENIKTQEVQVAVDNLTRSLMRQAQIKGLQDLISKETATQADLAAKALKNETVGWEKVIDIFKEAVDLGGNKTFSAGTTRLLEYGRAFDKAGERAKVFKDFLKNLLTEEASNKTLFIPEPDKESTEKLKYTLEQLFYKIKEDAGEGWQKLIDFSEKESVRYYGEWAKQVARQGEQQKVIDAYNRTNEAIRKGIIGIQPGGPAAATLPDTSAGNLEERMRLLKEFKEIGANPPDVSWVEDLGAGNILLRDSLGEITERMQVLGSITNEFLAPAFRSLFDNLVSGSQSAVEAVTGFLKNLVRQIISTIATAAALAAIMSAFGGGSFGGLFKGFLGFKGGGGGGMGFSGGGAGPSGGALAGASVGAAPTELFSRIDGNDILMSSSRTATQNGLLGG
jgi:hypothetical protein